MDRIEKFLKKLSNKELDIVYKVIEQLLADQVSTFDIKKLKGFDDIYRVRVGKIRIIYSQKNRDLKLIEISRRSEKTYKDF